MQEAPGELSQATCRICNSKSPRYRCSKCHGCHYCSRSCQAADWKEHRLACRALQAQSELLQLLHSSTLDQAHEDYNKAIDHVETLRKQESPPDKKKDDSASQPHQRPNASDADPNTEKSPRKLHPSSPSPITMPGREVSRHPRRHSPANHHIFAEEMSPKTNIEFIIQQLPNLSCYQMMLRGDLLKVHENIQTRLVQEEDDTGIIGERHTALLSFRDDNQCYLTIRLPGAIQDTRAYSAEDESALSVRLSYQPSTVSENSFQRRDAPFISLLTPDSAQTLACRFCSHELLSRSTSATNIIERILPLPSGRWEDIFPDYLMCYPGEPAIDIGAAATTMAVQEGWLFEDETNIVLHSNNVDACLLEVPGYGENPNKNFEDTDEASTMDLNLTDPDALVRGNRRWRDLVGGATLTCQLCASTLGFAQEESCRIFKHRVQWKKDNGSEAFTSLDVADFVAYEMVRYAEMKAIFAFQILQSNGGKASLWLRLLSWDASAATSKDSKTDKGVCHLEWHRMVQVLYEEVEEDEERSNDKEEMNDALNWMTWTKDWCCPPDKEEKTGDDGAESNNAPASAVRLWLSPQEGMELRQALDDGSNFYSKEVKQATIMAKTGRPVSHNTTGLAALLLSR